MSGHSKWSTIKRQKGANDAKRGQLFTKLSKAVTAAVRQGGGVTDPGSNFRLRLAIEAARSANMPKDNIDRAIQRASGKQAEMLEELTYEGFGPGGFSVVVEGLTDNTMRTLTDVKSTFNKNGGTLGAQGSVMYQFERKGVITVKKNGKTLDDIFMIAVENGADDLEEVGDEVFIYTKADDVAKIRDVLSSKELEITAIELTFRPIVINTITDAVQAEKALQFIEKMEDLDDVQKVYVNFDIPDELMKGN